MGLLCYFMGQVLSFFSITLFKREENNSDRVIVIENVLFSLKVWMATPERVAAFLHKGTFANRKLFNYYITPSFEKWGLLFKDWTCSLWEQILSFRAVPTEKEGNHFHVRNILLERHRLSLIFLQLTLKRTGYTGETFCPFKHFFVISFLHFCTHIFS